jgi:hypothetical protein
VLTRQSIVCVVAIQSFKTSGVIKFRDFNTEEARKCALPNRATAC